MPTRRPKGSNGRVKPTAEQRKLQDAGLCGRHNQSYGKPGAGKSSKHKYCRIHVSNPGDACWRHGGRSLKGEDHPSMVLGTQSLYAVPTRAGLADAFNAWINNPNLLSLVDEIALAKAAEQTLLREMADLDTSAALAERRVAARDQLRDAIRAADAAAVQRHLADLSDAVDEESLLHHKRAELRTQQRHVAGLIATHSEVIRRSRAYVPLEQVVFLAGLLVAAMKDPLDAALPRLRRRLKLDDDGASFLEGQFRVVRSSVRAKVAELMPMSGSGSSADS